MKKNNKIDGNKEFVEHWFFKVLIGITFTILILNTLWLIYPNFFNDYPYMFSDSWAILTDGFHFLGGYNYNYIAKNAGLPIMTAFLVKYDYMMLLPVFNQLVFGVFLFATYKLLIELKISKLSSMIVVFLVSISYFMQLYSVTILTDIYAVAFMAISILAFRMADKDKRFYILVALGVYLSLNFQYTAYVLGASYIVYVIIFRRDILKEKYLYLGSILLSPLIIWWYMYRYVEFGDPNYTKIVQFELLTPHLHGIPFYIINTISILGIPLTLVLILGLYKLFKEYKDKFYIFLGIYTLFMFIFWVIMYDWLDTRFLMNFITPIAVVIALGFDRLIELFKGLNVNFRYSALGLVICISAFYLQYNPPAQYWQNNILLLPGIGAYFETSSTKRQGIEGHYLKWHMVKFPLSKKNMGILDIAYKRLLYSRNTPPGVSDYAPLSSAANNVCQNCHLCLHSNTGLNNYFYRNKLTILLNKQVDGICNEDDIPMIETVNKVEGEIIYEGQGFTLYDNTDK